MARKYLIETFGCQMNVHDSERMAGLLEQAGYEATDDAGVTTRIDAADYLDAKLAAMRAHATQIAVDSPFFALSDMVGRKALGTEYYTLLAGPAWTPQGPEDREPDLFAGLG